MLPRSCLYLISCLLFVAVFRRRQLEEDLTGGERPSKPRPPPIKPLDLDAPRADADVVERRSMTDRDSASETATRERRRAPTFPKTTTMMIGWAQTLTPVLKNVRNLERMARPCGDIRKTFGWPPDGE